ncbi:MAG: DUF3267 domain-containing protein [Treponema sp.]|jgi:hypothetical protein|nr:DUF3267 domain-containing protein [Treponema sp.]
MKTNNFPEENYAKEEITLNIGLVYVFGTFVLVAAILLFGIPFYFIWPEKIQEVVNTVKNNYTMGLQERMIMGIKNLGIVLAIVLPLIVIHELIHGLFYSIFSKNGFKSIKFGIVPKKFILYCDCTEVLRKNHFIIGTIMPFILMGIIPAVISIFIGNVILLYWAILFIGAGCVDLAGTLKLLKEKNDSWIIFECTEMAGTIYRPKNNK